MSRPYLNVVNATKLEKRKNLVKHGWAQRVYTDTNFPEKVNHYTKFKPLHLDKPIPNLRTIPLATTPVPNVVNVLSPPTVVNLFDGGSPQSPTITKNPNIGPKNPTAIINASIVQNISGKMVKKNKVLRHASRLAKRARQTAERASAQASEPVAAQRTNLTVVQPTLEVANQTTVQGIAHATVGRAAQTTLRGAAKAKAAKLVSGNPFLIMNSGNAPPNTTKQTSGTGAPRQTTYARLTNQQKKKWHKIKQAMKKKGVTEDESLTTLEAIFATNNATALPVTNQGVAPNVTAQAIEAPTAVSTVTTDVAYPEPPKVPIIQKPSITITMKQKVQQETVKHPVNILKPDGNAAGNVPGTTVTPKASPGIVEVTQSAGVTLGSTIPILENRTVEPTSRVKADSFFKKAALSQPPAPPAPRPPLQFDRYAYRYTKGIPRTFLLQQVKSLKPGGLPIATDAPIWPSNPKMNAYQMNSPIFAQASSVIVGDNNSNPDMSPILVNTENTVDVEQPYSPSDVYSEQTTNPEPPELDSASLEQNPAGQKRLSAFHRLGPLSQPKKPKLTINLNLKKEQPTREVVNETDDDPDKYTPVHLRQDIMLSTDATVKKFLPFWPWKKNVMIRRSATARNSMSVMILEQEKMEELYEKDNVYIQITVKGYPSTWTKERLLDAIIDSVRGYSFIPCCIEFSQHECKFLVLRCRSALVVLHKTGFYIHKDGVELAITISIPAFHDPLTFIPRIILRKRIDMGYTDRKLDLSAFTLQNDISHFVYFPLNRVSNQGECVSMQTAVEWNKLVELNLSHNRLTHISGFDLANVTPKLKHLDLSYNYLEKITILLNNRELPLQSIRLEGNPLCHDYTDPQHYVKVIRMMFPGVVEIDGVKIHRKGELPDHKRNYCPEEAQEVAEKFVEIFFPLFDSGPTHRTLIQGMYEDNATLTVTYCYKLRSSQIYKNFRNLFLYARFLDEGEIDSVVGAMAITKLINRWPHTEHDPFTFTVDVMYHAEKTTILRIGGVLKLTAETLAEDEHLLSFTRTVVLYSEDETEYKIQNEMVYWHEPSAAAARSAFRVNTISQKNFNLKIESTTDEDLQDKFLKIFMKLTTMDKKISERCLEINNWNLKHALEHFTKLLKSNNLESLTQEVPVAS